MTTHANPGGTATMWVVLVNMWCVTFWFLKGSFFSYSILPINQSINHHF